MSLSNCQKDSWPEINILCNLKYNMYATNNVQMLKNYCQLLIVLIFCPKECAVGVHLM